jgi:hypothetical protein
VGIPLNRTTLASMLPTPDCFSRALLVALLAAAPRFTQHGTAVADACGSSPFASSTVQILGVECVRRCRRRTEFNAPIGSSGK